jgi:hypothetical protein
MSLFFLWPLLPPPPVPPLPPCTTTGLVNLCGVAPAYTLGISWFLITLPNVIWFGIVALFVVLSLFLPFPAKEVDFSGYERPGEEAEL